MAYAKLAELPVEFGLYSSFMGVLIYWFFATSKDITIGPVAVLSTVTGGVVLSAEEKLAGQGISRDMIASSLAIIAGSIVLFLGLARMGWIVDLISLPAISAFMTGSALSIAAGQFPTMMGITGFSTRDPTYRVVINSLKHLGRTNLNASFGLTCLFLLYGIRFTCGQLAKRFPTRAKLFFFINTLRTVFVILLYILFSYLANREHRANGTKPIITTLGTVPRGKMLLNLDKYHYLHCQDSNTHAYPRSRSLSLSRSPPNCHRRSSSSSSSISPSLSLLDE